MSTIRIRRGVALGATLAATLAGVVVLAAPASAHANAVHGSAVCQSDGTYTVSWSITNDFNLTETATVTGHTPSGSSLSASSVEIGVRPASGTVVQSGIPGNSSTATLAVHGVWSDGYGNGAGKGLASGSVALVGHCTQSASIPKQPQPSAPTCAHDGVLDIPADTVQVHWASTPTGTGPGTYTLTATTQPGFVFTDGTTTKKFTETVLPKLNPNSEDCATHITVPAPVFTNGDCSTAPTLTGATDGTGYTVSVDGTPDFGNTVTVTFAAMPNYRLDGKTVYTFTYAAKPDCRTAVSPVNPDVTQAMCDHTTGLDSGFSITPATTDGITYTVDGLVVTATANDGFQLGTLPSGWTSVGENHMMATYTVTRTDPECLIDVSPAAPTVVQSVCTGPGTSSEPSVTPADTTGLTYTVSADLSTVTATPNTGYEFGPLPDGWTLQEDGTAVFQTDLVGAGDCIVSVVAGSPTFADDVCVGNGPAGSSVTLPASLGVDFFVDGTLTPAGTTAAADGSTVTVTAQAQDGYTLTGATSWSHVFGLAPTCSQVSGLTVVALPAPRQTVAPAATVPLASTGVPTMSLLLLAGLLALGGVALSIGGIDRRRKRS